MPSIEDQIWEDYQRGLSYREIARKYHKSYRDISRIIKSRQAQQQPQPEEEDTCEDEDIIRVNAEKILDHEERISSLEEKVNNLSTELASIRDDILNEIERKVLDLLEEVWDYIMQNVISRTWIKCPNCGTEGYFYYHLRCSVCETDFIHGWIHPKRRKER